MIKLIAKRLPAESYIFSIIFTDDILTQPDTMYRVTAFNYDGDIIGSKVISLPISDTPEYLYDISDNITTIKTNLTAPVYGTNMHIRVERFDNMVSAGISDAVSVHSLVKPPILNPIDISEDAYNSAGIPLSLNLSWGSEISPRLIGYVIYYSLKLRDTYIWGEWQSLSEGASKLILGVSENAYILDTPYLSDVNTPQDIRVMIRGISDTDESMSSNIVSYEVTDTVTGLVTPAQSRIEYSYNNQSTRPVSLIFNTDRFAVPSVFVSLSKYRYAVDIPNYDESYSYHLTATAPLAKPISVILHVELHIGQDYQVRIFSNNKWVQIPASYNEIEKYISFTMHTISDFILLIPNLSLTSYNELITRPDKRFAYYTNLMLQNFPVYTKMRRNPTQSKGAEFLNAIGLEYEDMKFILDYATDQQYISTVDISVLDWVFKVKPKFTLTSDILIRIYHEDKVLQEVSDFRDFITISDRTSYRAKIIYDNPFIVDYDEQIIYIRKEYQSVRIEVYSSDTHELLHDDTYYPEWHHVWGFIDEFGMLMNLKRLPHESNIRFKERILDVFKNPSNASKRGLANGIARELGLRHNRIWGNIRIPMVITDPMVLINHIYVNGVLLDPIYISYNDNGHIVLSSIANDYRYIGSDTTDTEYAEVTWVSGLEMHTFYNERDYAFRHQLYNVDGTASNLFRYYVNRIKNEVPVEWGYFSWNEGYWDITDENALGYGYLPNVVDAHIDGFRNYSRLT